MNNTVLMLTRGYEPYVRNGRDRHVVELSKALVRLGEEIHVVTPNGGQLNEETIGQHEAKGGVHVHRFPNDFYVGNYLLDILYHNLGAKDYILEMMNQIHPDLIHCHDAVLGLAGVFAKKAFRAPLFLTVHYAYGRVSAGNSYVGKIEDYVIQHSDQIITVSEAMKVELKERYGVGLNVTVVPNGVSNRFYGKFNCTEPTESKVVLYVGRLVREKGVMDLMHAFALIHREYPRSELEIIGSGPLETLLRQLSISLGISAATDFVGFISDEGVLSEHYSRADVVVIPSHYEPFGLVALEAMASGVPVVTSGVGGLAEVVTDKSGLTVTPCSPTEIANAVCAIFGNPSLSAELSKVARLRSQEYDWRMIAKRTRQMYNDYIDQRV